MASINLAFSDLLSLHAEVLFCFIFQGVTAFGGAGSWQDAGKQSFP